MATTPTPIFPQSFLNAGLAIVNATGTTTTALTAATSNGSQCKRLMATSTDTVANNLLVYQNIGGTNYLIGAASIPAGAGTNGTTPPVNVIASLTGAPLDSMGNNILELAASDLIEVAAGTTVSSGKTLAVTATLDIF